MFDRSLYSLYIKNEMQKVRAVSSLCNGFIEQPDNNAYNELSEKDKATMEFVRKSFMESEKRACMNNTNSLKKAQVDEVLEKYGRK